MTPKDIIKVAINLVIIYLVGGLLLGFVYSQTSPVIYYKQKEEKRLARKKVMPEAERFPKGGDWEIYEKHPEFFLAVKGDDLLGFLAESYGKGYSSYINVLISTDRDFIVQDIKILHHAETPGLGDEILLPYFKDQFKGKKLDQLEVVKREGTDKILAITGATISSRAVTEAVHDAVEMLTEQYGGKVDSIKIPPPEEPKEKKDVPATEPEPGQGPAGDLQTEPSVDKMAAKPAGDSAADATAEVKQ